MSRDTVIDRMSEQQIGTSIHFKPIHRFRYYRETRRVSDDDYPVASSYADRTVRCHCTKGCLKRTWTTS